MDQLIHILKGLFSLDLPSCPVSSEQSHRPRRGRRERKYTCSKVQFQTTEIPPNRSRCGPEGRSYSLLDRPRELLLEFKTPIAENTHTSKRNGGFRLDTGPCERRGSTLGMLSVGPGGVINPEWNMTSASSPTSLLALVTRGPLTFFTSPSCIL